MSGNHSRIAHRVTWNGWTDGEPPDQQVLVVHEKRSSESDYSLARTLSNSMLFAVQCRKASRVKEE